MAEIVTALLIVFFIVGLGAGISAIHGASVASVPPSPEGADLDRAHRTETRLLTLRDEIRALEGQPRKRGRR